MPGCRPVDRLKQWYYRQAGLDRMSFDQLGMKYPIVSVAGNWEC